MHLMLGEEKVKCAACLTDSRSNAGDPCQISRCINTNIFMKQESADSGIVNTVDIKRW